VAGASVEAGSSVDAPVSVASERVGITSDRVGAGAVGSATDADRPDRTLETA
jgi:hypothetical protein